MRSHLLKFEGQVIHFFFKITFDSGHHFGDGFVKLVLAEKDSQVGGGERVVTKFGFKVADVVGEGADAFLEVGDLGFFFDVFVEEGGDDGFGVGEVDFRWLFVEFNASFLELGEDVFDA